MQKIDIRSWGEFRLKNLYGDCIRGTRLTQAKRIDGSTPLVTAGFENEGIAGYISNPEMTLFENCLTIDMFGNCFYRQYKFNADDNILCFDFEQKNKYVCMFLASVLNQANYLYDYTNQYRKKNYDKQTIKLPIDSKGNPDWNYMENYMRNIETKVYAALSKLEKAKEVEAKWIDISGWGEFQVSQVFETTKKGKFLQVPTGANVPKINLLDGDIPRITVTGINNGVYGYYQENPNEPNYRIYENFISVSFLGSVFYQHNKVSLDMKVHCLKPLNHILNEYTGRFLVTAILASLKESSYSDQISSTVLPTLSIRLPSNYKGNPDWQYMENYMRNIETKVNNSLSKLLG